MKRWLLAHLILAALLTAALLILLTWIKPEWTSVWWWVLLICSVGLHLGARALTERFKRLEPESRVQAELAVMVGRLLLSLALLLVVILSSPNALHWPLGGGFLVLYFALRTFDIWGRLPTLRAQSGKAPKSP